MTAKKKVRKKPVHLIYWWDIEQDAGWGHGESRPCLVTTVGFIIKRPRTRDKVRSFVVAVDYDDSLQPGAPKIIPEAVIVDIIKLGDVEIKHRSQM